MQVEPALQMRSLKRAPIERDALVSLDTSKVFYSKSLIRSLLIRLRVLLDFLHVSNVPTILLLLLHTSRIVRAEPINHLRDYLPTEARGHPTFANHQWVYLPSWVKRHEGDYPQYGSLILLPVLKPQHERSGVGGVRNHFDWSTVKKRDGPPRRCGMKLIKYIQK